MRIYPITLLIISWFCAHTVAQEKATVNGTVTTSKQPLPYASIQYMNTEIGATADVNGAFTLTGLPAGKGAIKIRSVGYRTLTKEVNLRPGETLVLDVELLEDNLQLNEVVVSATRYELDRSESPVIVNVLGSKLFNATQSMALSEGLNFQPGVRVENNCQNCGFTQVRLNGLEGAYSQILINSRPIFSALSSVYGLDQIPTNIVERVEVVRSGGSALYGSNAIAGTINIITREPVENTWQVASNFALVDGTEPDNTVNFNASVVSEDLQSGVTFYGMFRNRDAFDANDDGFTEITQLENNTFGAKAFLRINDRSKVTVDFNAIREYRRGGDRLDLAPHFTDISEELDHNTIITGLNYELFSADGSNKLSAYVSAQTTDRDSFYGGLGGGRTPGDSLVARNAYGNTEDLALVGGLQFSRNFSSGDVLVLGVENQLSDVEDVIQGYNRLVDQSVNTIGVYGQYEWKPINRFTALVGARFDHTAVDGQYDIGDIQRTSDVTTNVFSPRLTVLYDLTSRLQLRGGYARGFRAPQAFNEDLHISSVGGEPQFVILTENLDKELSDAFTASLNYTRNFGDTQANFLIEGFYTDLKNPFTIVSTGAVLPNGSILEEVRNGEGAFVAGTNFEASFSPSSSFLLKVGGTAQQTGYDEDQVLFEPEDVNEGEPAVITDEFIRNPNLYGYLTANWVVNESFAVDVTGTYTGSMIVPRVVSESGFLDLRESDPFTDINLKLSRHFDLKDSFHLELSGGVQNVFNSFQDDFDTGPERDSDYVYGPTRPRTFFIGLKIGNF